MSCFIGFFIGLCFLWCLILGFGGGVFLCFLIMGGFIIMGLGMIKGGGGGGLVMCLSVWLG